MKEICNKSISKYPSLKRAAGIITAVSQGSVSANVTVVGSTANIVLLNKTGQILEEGDHVWINYWQSINDGYIAIKAGDGEYGLGVGDGTNTSTISIDNAFLLREGGSEYITTHSYDPNDSYDVTDFIIPASGALGAISRVDQFPSGNYLYTAPLTLSSGQVVINIGVWGNAQSNNFYMYQTLSIQNYLYISGSYQLETKYVRLENTEVTTGHYIAELVVLASEHEAEKRYPLMATAGSMEDLNDYRIILELAQIRYLPSYSTNSLTVSLNMIVLKYHHAEVYVPDEYWYVHKQDIPYHFTLPLISTAVDANTHVGNMVDTKERRVVV